MRIVIKIGTSTLTKTDGSLNAAYINALGKTLALLKNAGHEIVLVSSGAIGAGIGHLGVGRRPKTIRQKQALAAIGQPLVMDAYRQSLKPYKVGIAQVLITRYDFDSRTNYLNARNTISEILSYGIVPIINENDTVAVEEINFGDNDTLAALVAVSVAADAFFIFTDVSGLYRDKKDKNSLIEIVPRISKEVYALAGGAQSSKGTGGMVTKLDAAKIATLSGIKTAILSGKDFSLLPAILNGERFSGTLFEAAKTPMEAKKSWIAFGKKCSGSIYVDDNAAKALTEKGKSLLAKGIVKVSGNFNLGDNVSIHSGNAEVARGLVNYGSKDLSKIAGKNSSDIEKILNKAVSHQEAVHRDNMVIVK